MIQFVCDSCFRVKRPEEAWLLGLAAESLGVTAARREITILSASDRDRAVHPLAVHFCSEACKDHYIEQLFGSEEPEVEEVVEVTTTTARSKAKRAGTSKVKIRKARKSAA